MSLSLSLLQWLEVNRPERSNFLDLYKKCSIEQSNLDLTQPLRALFIDMDSYFASVEQHFRPHLRGKPVAVAPMLVESTCCIAASYEAKAFGVKTGTRVSEARQMCPGIVILHARPPLYVEVHHQIVELVESCIHVDAVLSIDEMVCWLPTNWRTVEKVTEVGELIQLRLKEQFSEALSCSIGVAPNGWLAKIASKMRKPKGFFVIQSDDLPEVLHELKLTDLHGVGANMELRLHAQGLHSVARLCVAPKEMLEAVWRGLEGARIWHRLRGEDVQGHDANPERRSISHGHVLPPEFRPPHRSVEIAHRLLQKAALRMRTYGMRAGRLTLSVKFENGAKWVGELSFAETANSIALTRMVKVLWNQRSYPVISVRKINIVLDRLVTDHSFTPSLFEQVDWVQEGSLNEAMDRITAKFGKKALYLGGAHDAMKVVEPKIAFNHIPEIEIER